MKEYKYYGFQDILKFIGIDYEFQKKSKVFPFTLGVENVEFSWGQVIISRYGIEKMVQNKISEIEEKTITEIKFMYQIPFSTLKNGFGIINKNISLSFRYDKEYKYGDITKSIYECCYWILEHSKKTNDFYIISDDMVQEFFTYCVIDNQWGLGSLVVCSPPYEKLGKVTEIE